MGRLTLGLDIGSYSIKAALVKRGFRQPELIEFKQVVFPEGEGHTREAVAAALKQLLSSLDLKGVRVITRLPVSISSYRLLTLPFDSPAQIKGVLPFELQGHIPFPLEEAFIDFQLLDVNQGTSSLLAASAIRSSFHEHVNCLKDAGVEPRVIEAGPLCLYRLFRFGEEGKKGRKALIDLGASNSSVCLFDSGNLRLARTFPIGGEAVTQILQERLGVSWEHAEELKRTEGLEGDEAGRLIQEALGPLVDEIWRTFSIFEGSSGLEIEEIYLCGGLSNLKGLEGFLKERLGRQVKPFRPLAGFDTVLKGAEEMEKVMAASLGLALRAISKERRKQINFSAMAVAPTVEPQRIRRRGIALGAMALLLAALYIANLHNTYRRQESHYTSLKQAEAELYGQTLPKGEKARIDTLKAMVARLEKEIGSFQGMEKGYASALDLLGEVASRLPRERQTAFREYTFDRDRIKILGETDSFAAVDELTQKLTGYQGFKEVRVESTEAKDGGKSVAFELTLLFGGK